MGIRVAYGDRAKIETAIQTGVIPKDSIIIAKVDDTSTELMFYDAQANLRNIVPNTRFKTVEDAKAYTLKKDSVGRIVTILENDKFVPYIVQPDLTLTELAGDAKELHTHANKELLDSITAERMEKWDSNSTSLQAPIINISGTDIVISDLSTGIYNIDGSWKVTPEDVSRETYNDDLFYVMRRDDGVLDLSWISSTGIKSFHIDPNENVDPENPDEPPKPPVVKEDVVITAENASDNMVGTF